MSVEGRDEVTHRDRYHARIQIIAAVIGALVAGLLAGLFGGRQWEERALEGQIAASEDAVNRLRDELAERTDLIDTLRTRVDAQEKTIGDLQANSARQPQDDSPELKGQDLEAGSEASSEPEAAILAVQEVAGIGMGLLGCSRSGPRVTCDFIIVNHDNDRQLEICAPACYGNQSRLVDSQGIEYKPDSSYLGGSYTHRPTAVLAREVPLRAGIRFDGVDSRSRSIGLLEVGIRVSFGKDYLVQFRDITLE